MKKNLSAVLNQAQGTKVLKHIVYAVCAVHLVVAWQASASARRRYAHPCLSSALGLGGFLIFDAMEGTQL